LIQEISLLHRINVRLQFVAHEYNIRQSIAVQVEVHETRGGLLRTWHVLRRGLRLSSFVQHCLVLLSQMLVELKLQRIVADGKMYFGGLAD